jgi:hypothetical protein
MVTPAVTGSISREATTQPGNIFREAMRGSCVSLANESQYSLSNRIFSQPERISVQQRILDDIPVGVNSAIEDRITLDVSADRWVVVLGLRCCRTVRRAEPSEAQLRRPCLQRKKTAGLQRKCLHRAFL